MNMYLFELKSLRKSTVIWTLSMLAIATLYLSLFSSMAQDAAGFQKLLAGYPEQVRAMLGVALDTITTLPGYYSMVVTFVILCGGIQAMNMGLSILSRETRERTADFLLVKPVSRAAVVNAKLLSALTMLFATDIVFYAVAYTLATIASSDFRQDIFFLLNLPLLFVQLIFLSLGMIISVFFKNLKTVLPISLGTTFGLYILGSILATAQDDPARFISPFRYFSNQYIIANAGYELPYLLTGAAIVAVGIAASYFLYGRKDIHAVS